MAWPIWISVTLWELMAENANELLRKGSEVVCSGSLELETFEKKDGSRGEKLVLRNAEVAPSIRRADRASVMAATAAAGGSDSRPRSGSNGRPQARPQGGDRRSQVEDPWASSSGDAPPF